MPDFALSRHFSFSLLFVFILMDQNIQRELHSKDVNKVRIINLMMAENGASFHSVCVCVCGVVWCGVVWFSVVWCGGGGGGCGGGCVCVCVCDCVS